MTTFSIVLVCTGNTCRSPMAADILRRLLPEGVRVGSAGVAALEGAAASNHARFVVGDRGGHLEEHRAQPLSAEMVESADLVLTMTRAQRDLLRGRHGPRARRILSLGEIAGSEGEDVEDPFGGDLGDYEAVYEQIESLLKAALPALRERIAREGNA